MTRKVLVVAHAHPDESPTGAELAAYELFRAMRAVSGWTAQFAAPRVLPRLMGERLAPWAGRAHEWELPTGEMDAFLLSQRNLGALDAFAELLRREQPDVVHLHHYIRSGIEAMALVRRVLPGARLIVTLHEFLAICANSGQMVKAGSLQLCNSSSPEACAACYPERTPDEFAARRRYVLANLLKADMLVAPSEFLRHRYIEWGVPADRIVMIENYVPLLQSVPPRPLPAGARRAAFGFFGSIGVFKGVRTLVEAFTILRSTLGCEDATLTLHGVPGYMPREFQLWFETAMRRQAPAVRWSGRYGRDDLTRLMSEVDWVVMPSIWWENSPLVIQEALTIGRPLIVSDIGGMAEKVRGGLDGFTFAAGDPRALAETMAFAIPRFDAMRRRDMAGELEARLGTLIALYSG
jgi:glycosyltransferase involved in cell wall biosynthesis